MKFTVDVALTPADLAKAFCDLDDERQAQFFIEVAAIARDWKGGLGSDWQWYTVGRHLRTCSCSNDEARAVVTGIAEGLTAEY